MYLSVLKVPSGRTPRRRLPVWCAAALLALLVAGVGVWIGHRTRPAAAPRRAPPPPPVAARPEPPWRELCFPTEQQLVPLTDPAAVLQPTASGRPESALFGTTRTGNRGGSAGPSFHEGVDIAAARRDRAARPLDEVRAIAGGWVAYVNSVAGNSTYGCYIVIAHPDPMGAVYSLYGHLAAVQPGFVAGRSVAAAEVIGRMGNTSSLGIPMQRAHLHLEIGLLGNAHYDRWFRAQKLTPDHGVFNGQNFLGIDPLAFFRHQRAHPDCGFVDFLTTLPAAFEVVLNTNAPLDFFRRHPVLWRDGVYAGGPIVMGCAENGLPLWGRRASPADCAAMGSGVHGVVDVDETVVRGSGCRLLGRSGGRWGLTSKGVRWLEALTYPQKLKRGKSGS